MPDIEASKKEELTSKFREFLEAKYKKSIVKAAEEEQALIVSFKQMAKRDPELGEYLLNWPDAFFEVVKSVVGQMDLPGPVKVRFKDIPDMISIRDLRSEHIGKFICTEGIVRRASEIRPEITAIYWECPNCGERIKTERITANYIPRPSKCNCGNTKGFKQAEKEMIDTRWVVIEEPFELTEGERPSQVTVLLTEDLTSPEGRRMTDPGNRLKVTGVLRDIPKGKSWSVKLDFYLDANHCEPTEVGWEKLKISKQDEEEIKKLAKDPKIYEKLIDSLAPSLYGMREIKESIILQLFGGVRRTLKDNVSFRGDIHILLIGDPASGKSQLMKLVPNLTPRGRYVSGKGVTTAGLTATVTKDEQFMGGWVLEAGAIVLANKGLLSVDEFEKMSPDDQVAMHEALEQGTVSIAKASIVTTLPAQTSVLAGGNPKFSRFDPYQSISKQITIPDTLLSRFDLKFILRDRPDPEEDKKIVEHILGSREEDYMPAVPKLPSDLIKKYIAYAKEHCHPVHTKETGKILKHFYVESRRKAVKEEGPVPITLRQFEALMRLAEASARIQLSPVVRKQDAQRAIRLMKYSLEQLGMTQSGLIDVDKAEGLTTASERSHIRTVLDIIEILSQKKKEIDISELEEMAKKEGVPKPGEIIERLKREGMLFEPSPGFVQKV